MATAETGAVPEIASPLPEPVDGSSLSIGDRALLAVVVAVAAVLRLYQLGGEGLWFDEANTAVLAGLPVSRLLERITVDNQAPLYFLLVKAAMALLGSAEWAVRSVSAASGIALVWLAYDVGRRTASRRAAQLAAILVATSPMAIHYSQEARPYALLMLLVLAGFRAASAFDERPTCGRGLWLVAVLLATCLTHNIGPFYVVGLAVAFVSCSRLDAHRLKWWGAVLAAISIGYLVWLPNLLHQSAGMVHSFAWAGGVWTSEFPFQIPRSWAAMSHGSLAPIRNRVPEIIGQAWVAVGLSVLLWVGGFLRRSRLADPRLPVLLLLAGITPLAGMWLYSVVARAPIYLVGRVDSPALPLFLLLTAAGVVALKPAWSWLGTAALVGLAVLPLRMHWTVDFRSQERAIAHLLDSHRADGEPVITTAFDCSLIHYTDLRHGELLMLYPSATEPYLGWVDWSRYDTTLLEADADEVSLQAMQRARQSASGSVWLLLRPDPRYAAIANALARRMTRSGELDLGHLGMKLAVYKPISPRLDPGDTSQRGAGIEATP
jgi:4-amino-4-deoxy-L-arabinose transferase-like glycosyltransferase